jgi:hypothetical protein
LATTPNIFEAINANNLLTYMESHDVFPCPLLESPQISSPRESLLFLGMALARDAARVENVMQWC